MIDICHKQDSHFEIESWDVGISQAARNMRFACSQDQDSDSEGGGSFRGAGPQPETSREQRHSYPPVFSYVDGNFPRFQPAGNRTGTSTYIFTVSSARYISCVAWRQHRETGESPNHKHGGGWKFNDPVVGVVDVSVAHIILSVRARSFGLSCSHPTWRREPRLGGWTIYGRSLRWALTEATLSLITRCCSSPRIFHATRTKVRVLPSISCTSMLFGRRVHVACTHTDYRGCMRTGFIPVLHIMYLPSETFVAIVVVYSFSSPNEVMHSPKSCERVWRAVPTQAYQVAPNYRSKSRVGAYCEPLLHSLLLRSSHVHMSHFNLGLCLFKLRLRL